MAGTGRDLTCDIINLEDTPWYVTALDALGFGLSAFGVYSKYKPTKPISEPGGKPAGEAQQKPNASVAEDLGEVRYREGSPVTPMEKTYEMALDPEYYANEVAKKYGINLKGSGQEIEIKFNPDLACAGKSRKLTPNIIEIGPSAYSSEEELANTIAHELNHARDWLKGGTAPDWPDGTHPGTYSAGDALGEYIGGQR